MRSGPGAVRGYRRSGYPVRCGRFRNRPLRLFASARRSTISRAGILKPSARSARKTVSRKVSPLSTAPVLHGADDAGRQHHCQPGFIRLGFLGFGPRHAEALDRPAGGAEATPIHGRSRARHWPGATARRAGALKCRAR
jgi:hypothetical protein